MNHKDLEKEMVASHVRTDTILLSENAAIGAVIDTIRTSDLSDQIVYFYVTNNEQCLVGVLPLRRLLSAQPEQCVREVMVPNVVVLSEDDTLATAQRQFHIHKYLSLPVINGNKKFIGVFDITVLTGNRLNLSESHRFDDVFETIGIRASMVRYLTPFTAFKYRFPWIIPTMLSGLACALLASFFERTISESIILAFFLTMILGLGESVSIQTLTITIRRLQVEKPTRGWYLESFIRELVTSLFMGTGVGVTLLLIVFLWKGEWLSGISIGASALLSLISATFFGLSVPALLHTTRLDPRVSAGPLVLGLADLCTLFFYFTLAAILL